MVDGQKKSIRHYCAKQLRAFNNRDMDREIEDAVQREKEAHERSIKEWEARLAAQELKDHPEIPPPKETSSMRVVPDVHAALRQNDPSMLHSPHFI